jgi:dihydrofolate synthase/folylpolyglutamate synthase
LLGKTINSIATEKAGIIKPLVPVVVGEIKGTAIKTIIGIAKRKKSPVLLSSKISLPKNAVVQLKGNHQISNAKTAVAAITIISRHFIVGDKAIIEGLQNTIRLSGLRGRFELIETRSPILLDVAHNPDGMKVLAAEIKKLGYKRIVIIFAAMKDKDYRHSLLHLKSMNPLIIAAQPKGDRALSVEKLYATCTLMKLHCLPSSSIKESINLGKRHSRFDGLLVITGSHYLVGEAIPLLKLNKKNARQ